ncbi:unnamed protein product [Macrosiphum euphorbiae]|uniref:GED domain-containing protein n=1 Tax=Macrosiphum euphorbiae TaxID=13131 RepID=A0AAV0VP63_9HEMI|nr:unnamed protein product [Macrosiphum euphorbiae]
MLKVLNSIDVNLLDTLRRYSKLYEDVRKVFEKLLEENVNNIKEFITSYIESYQECINTANPDFISEILKSDDTIQEEILAAVNIKKHESDYKPELVLNPTGRPIFRIPDRMAQTNRLKTVRTHMLKQLLSGLNNQDIPLESSEQIKLHKYLSQCYFEYIRKIVRDFVPKRVVHKMVNSFLKNLDKRLNEEIFQTYLKENKIGEVLIEDESIINDRKDVEIKLDAVGKALKTIVDIRNC